MKKTVALLLISILCFSLFSCRKKADNDDPYIESVDRAENEEQTASETEESSKNIAEKSEDTTEKAEDTEVSESEDTTEKAEDTEVSESEEEPETDDLTVPTEPALPSSNEEQSQQYDKPSDSDTGNAEEGVREETTYDKPELQFYLFNTDRTYDEIDTLYLNLLLKTNYIATNRLGTYPSDSEQTKKCIQALRMIYTFERPAQKTIPLEQGWDGGSAFQIFIHYKDGTGSNLMYYPDKKLVGYLTTDDAWELYTVTDEFDRTMRSFFVKDDYPIDYEIPFYDFIYKYLMYLEGIQV